MKRVVGMTALYLVLTLFVLFSATPFYWALASSFKPQNELFEKIGLLPRSPTLNNYVGLFRDTRYLNWYFNSCLVAVSFTLLVVFFSSLAGFAFSKYDFRGKKALFMTVIGSMTIPVWAIVIPLYVWFTYLGLINTLWALILPECASPFSIFLMRQYIHGLPTDLIDSARIDGCPEFRIYYNIILPIIKPAVGAVAIFAFLLAWNNFIGPLVFIRSDQLYTLPVGLASFVGQKDRRYGLLMAGGILSFLPIIILFLNMQRQFISGLALGSLKE